MPSEETQTIERESIRKGEHNMDESKLEADIEGEVDSDVKRRIEKAYMNDDRSELIVERLGGNDEKITVEMRTPYSDETHTQSFISPEKGSLQECPEFVEFLEGIGVSPLDLDDVVGTTVPAKFSKKSGWVVDRSQLISSTIDENLDSNNIDENGVVENRDRPVINWIREYPTGAVALTLIFFMFVVFPFMVIGLTYI